MCETPKKERFNINLGSYKRMENTHKKMEKDEFPWWALVGCAKQFPPHNNAKSE